mgnify:CR=1 FL=1
MPLRVRCVDARVDRGTDEKSAAGRAAVPARGLGGEVGITRNWSVASEYVYASLGAGRYQLAGGAGSYAWDVGARSIHMLTARVNYRL